MRLTKDDMALIIKALDQATPDSVQCHELRERLVTYELEITERYPGIPLNHSLTVRPRRADTSKSGLTAKQGRELSNV